MGTEMETESGKPSQYAKMIDMIDHGVTLDEYLDIKEVDSVDKYLEYLGVAESRDYGITPEIWVQYRQAQMVSDLAGRKQLSQDEVEAAIDAMSGNAQYGIMLPGGDTVQLTNEQKAVLWQMYNKGWGAKNNPYDTDVGQAVIDARG